MEIRNLDFLSLDHETGLVYGCRKWRGTATFSVTYATDGFANADASAFAFGDNTLAETTTYTNTEKYTTRYKVASESEASADAFAFAQDEYGTSTSKFISKSRYKGRSYSV